jgi:hypothetical protein
MEGWVEPGLRVHDPVSYISISRCRASLRNPAASAAALLLSDFVGNKGEIDEHGNNCGKRNSGDI